MRKQGNFLKLHKNSPVSNTEPRQPIKRSAQQIGNFLLKEISEELLQRDSESLKARGTVFVENRQPLSKVLKSRSATEPRLQAFYAPDKRQQPLQSSGKPPRRAKTDKTSKVVGAADTTPKGVIDQESSLREPLVYKRANRIKSIRLITTEEIVSYLLCVNRFFISKTSRDSLKIGFFSNFPYKTVSVTRFCVLHVHSACVAFQKLIDFRANVLSYSVRSHDLSSLRKRIDKGHFHICEFHTFQR